MICDTCGLPLLGTETFCPQCGTQIEQRKEPSVAAAESQVIAAPEPEPEVIEVDDLPVVATSLKAPQPGPRPAARLQPPARTPRSTLAELRTRFVGPMGVGMVAGCLVFIVIGLTLLGVWQGLRLRAEKRAESASKYYAQGLDYMAEGNYDLAIGAFEYALRLRRDYPEAREKLEEARAKAAGQPTPASQQGRGDPATLLSQGRAAYDQGNWAEAIAKLEALHAQDPAYEQATVQRLLIGAYGNEGVRLANEDRMEEAIRRFDQALALQPDNSDLEIQRRLAVLYQSGLSAWDADWQTVIRSLSSLYTLRPDYKDTAQRLQRAYVLAGDAAATESDWCEAAQYYKAALSMASTPELAAKRDEAARLCASPTTPGAPLPSGTFIGIVGEQQKISASWGKVQGQVLDRDGNPVPGLTVRLSAYDWSATAYTDSGGCYAFEALQNEITFTVTLDDVPAQPTDVNVKLGYISTVDFHEKK